MKANIYRRSGDWAKAKEHYLKALEQDPGSPTITLNTAETLYLIGDYAEAEKYYDKTFSLNPSFFDPYREKCLMYMKWTGSTEKARSTIENASRFIGSSQNPLFTELKVLMDIYDGEYQRAIIILKESGAEIFEDLEHFSLSYLLLATLNRLTDKPEEAYDNLNEAFRFLDKRIKLFPDDSRLYSAMGLTYAGLGQKQKAIEAGRKAIELMPVSKEAWRGVLRLEDLAKIYTITGELKAAIELIKKLLGLPGPFSEKLLGLDPVWRPLLNHPDLMKITSR